VQGAPGVSLGGNPEVTSISCPSVGNCTAGGVYLDGGGVQEPFVVDEKNGVWGGAIPVPNIPTLNYSSAFLGSVSCKSVGNCSAGGSYSDNNGAWQAWVAIEKGGVWKKAIKLPGTAAKNLGNYAATLSVSCGAVGYCSAGGFYTDANNVRQAFVAKETMGVWRAAVKVSGTGAVNTSGAQLTSVSCRGQSSCAAGGFYIDSNGYYQAFVVTEKQGVWGAKKLVAPPSMSHSQVTSVSCATAGNCIAGGFNFDGGQQAFVVRETSGTWGTPTTAPGSADLNAAGLASVNSVSCAKAATSCTIGGYYTDSSGLRQAFVTAP
jgi:hypothetical protein